MQTYIIESKYHSMQRWLIQTNINKQKLLELLKEYRGAIPVNYYPTDFILWLTESKELEAYVLEPEVIKM